MTPDITVDKARNMLLKEERRTVRDSQITVLYEIISMRSSDKRISSRKTAEAIVKCFKCEKNYKESRCW